MRIAFLKSGDFFKVQGAAEVYYVFNYLKKRHEVCLFTDLGGEELPESVKRYFSLKPNGFISRIIVLIGSLIALRRYDLIYSYRGHFFLTYFGKLILGKKLIYDLRTAPVEQAVEFWQIDGGLSRARRLKIYLKKRLYQFILPRADKVVAISEGVKEILVNKYGVPDINVYLLSMGVDLDIFNPQHFEKRAASGKSNSMICVTSVAGKWRAKGIETVIDGIKILRNDGHEIELVLVGSVPDHIVEHLKLYAQKRQVGDLVKIVGYVSHDQIPELLSQYEIALSPLADLVAYRVASPTKVFEYLAMRKVVLASDIRSNRGVIKDGWNGLLYKAGDSKDFADKIKEIMLKPDLRAKLRERSRESVRIYEWKVLLRNLDRDIIDKCLAV